MRILLLTTVLLIASGSSASRARVEPVSLRTSGSELTLGSSWLVFSVGEADEGRDLNRDGDASDSVLHAANVDRLLLRRAPRRLAAPKAISSTAQPHAMWDRFAVLVTLESDQGNTDLNGDGDALDRVLQVFDLRSEALRVLRAVNGAFQIADGVVLFGVPELDEASSDLNSDGDIEDVVLHTYELASGSFRNWELAVNTQVFIRSEDRLAIGVYEAAQGLADLTGDGDFLDDALFVLDLDSGVVTNLGKVVVRTCSISEPQPCMAFAAENYLLFQVDEQSGGAQDLNADGDTDDIVAHAHDFVSGVSTSLGLATSSGAVFDGGDFAAFVGSESQQGEDLNGDGDTFDGVVHTFDSVGVLSSSNLAGQLRFAAAGRLGIAVHEVDQGMNDLNGDGDVSDDVLFLLAPDTGVSNNLGLGADLLVSVGHLIFFAVDESDENRDLNGDGDFGDFVAHLIDLTSNQLRNLSLNRTLFAKIDGRLIAFTVPEDREHEDFNGDGDSMDQILFVHDASRGITLNTQLPASDIALRGYRVAYNALEEQLDQNGDGDRLDPIVSVVDVRSAASIPRSGRVRGSVLSSHRSHSHR